MNKRKFLYYNLHNIENNKRIILHNYINEKQIDHSENSNGLLLNLSTISEEHIKFFYDLYNMENNYQVSKYDQIPIPTPTNDKRLKGPPINYPDYDLSALEKLILSYSY